jgi:hypothetical protein
LSDMRTLLAVAAFSVAAAVAPAFAQPDLSDPIQAYQLSDGSVIQHLQYEGALLRLDKTGRRTGRAKLPKSSIIEESTRVVVSESEENLLVVHSSSTFKWPPKHRVLFLDVQSLKTMANLPLGDCEFAGVEPFAATQRLVCQQSRNPSDRKKKPTLAFVALDLNRGSVLTWFDLGGERRGSRGRRNVTSGSSGPGPRMYLAA